MNEIENAIMDIDSIVCAYTGGLRTLHSESQAQRWKKIKEMLCELKSYQDAGYTPAEVSELEDKHHSECMQIARYDDQIKAQQEHIDRLKGVIDGLMGYMGGCEDGT